MKRRLTRMLILLLVKLKTHKIDHFSKILKVLHQKLNN